MLSYNTPKSIHGENEIYDPKVQHRVNLFGHCKNIQERVRYILEINSNAFSEECGFVDDIYSLLSTVSHSEWSTVTHTLSPRHQYEELLTTHMQRQEPTIHHIIFNNRHLHGHPSHKDNQIILARGVHTSFHELLDQKNLYPHKQLTKLLTMEKETFDKKWYQEINIIQNFYETLFRTDPRAVYNRNCFHERYRK